MTITGIEYVHASPYLTKGEIAEILKISIPTLDNRIREIKKETERYGDFALIKDGGIMIINFLALIDYMKYRDRLSEKCLRKNVPPYNPEAIAKAMGWTYNLNALGRSD